MKYEMTNPVHEEFHLVPHAWLQLVNYALLPSLYSSHQAIMGKFSHVSLSLLVPHSPLCLHYRLFLKSWAYEPASQNKSCLYIPPIN